MVPAPAAGDGGPTLPAAARQPEWLSYSGLLLIVFIFFDFVVLSLWGFGGDWSPLWVAGAMARTDPSRVYNFAEVTKLLVPLTGDYGVRPFVYPPSALIFLVPLSFIPFRLSVACVSLTAAVLLSAASSRRETDRLLLLLSPPIVFTAIAGQPTLPVAALTAWALSKLQRNELHAGVLLGAAAMLKPTLLIMAPVGLIAGKHWRALVSAGVAALATGAVSVILFGVGTWVHWIAALVRFRGVFEAFPALYRNGITPYALSLRMGLYAPWLTWGILPVAALLTAAVFVRTSDWRARMAAAVAGSLLASPYAMSYELAAFAPFVLTSPREKLTHLLLPTVWGVALFFNGSLLAMLAVYAAALTMAPALRSHAPTMDA